jgi:flagellar basal body-associated protein FliL
MEQQQGNHKPNNMKKLIALLLLLVYMILAPLMVLFIVFFARVDFLPMAVAVVAIGTGLIALALLNLFVYSKDTRKKK